MWIFDSYYKGCVELWGRERGLTKVSAATKGLLGDRYKFFLLNHIRG